MSVRIGPVVKAVSRDSGGAEGVNLEKHTKERGKATNPLGRMVRFCGWHQGFGFRFGGLLVVIRGVRAQ